MVGHGMVAWKTVRVIIRKTQVIVIAEASVYMYLLRQKEFRSSKHYSEKPLIMPQLDRLSPTF